MLTVAQLAAKWRWLVLVPGFAVGAGRLNYPDRWLVPICLVMGALIGFADWKAHPAKHTRGRAELLKLSAIATCGIGFLVGLAFVIGAFLRFATWSGR